MKTSLSTLVMSLLRVSIGEAAFKSACDAEFAEIIGSATATWAIANARRSPAARRL